MDRSFYRFQEPNERRTLKVLQPESFKLPPPTCRYFMNVMDLTDGKVKILDVGPTLHRKIMETLLEKKPVKKNRLQKVWSWIKSWFVKPEPTPLPEFTISAEMTKQGFYKHHVS